MQTYNIKNIETRFILQQPRVKEAQPCWLHEDKRFCIPPSETALRRPRACIALRKLTWMVTRWFKAQGRTLSLNNILCTKGGQR